MRTVLKRMIDFVGALLGLIVLSPVLAVVAVVVRACMGSPVLLGQVRPGLKGKPFRLFKFRTMTDERNEHGELLPDEERLTWVGRIIRGTSLDELPQLWNVLVGEMSLVGPRPLLTEYLARYTPEQARRHEVKPGITGWSQVNGRNAITWDEKLSLDVWYVDHGSLWLDLRILAMTVVVVLLRQGISQAGKATMAKFQGSGGGPGQGRV